MNQDYLDTIVAAADDDLPFVETLLGLIKHRTELQSTFQMNCTDLMDGTTNRVFFRLYRKDAGGWVFHDYGWLSIEPTDYERTVVARFCTYKSKLTLFVRVIDVGNNTYVVRHDDSPLHCLIRDEENQWLLYNPYPQSVHKLFSCLMVTGH